jgi:hypothetical protein
MTHRMNTTEANAPIPGHRAARNALTDAKTPPEVQKAARDLLGYTDPIGWKRKDTQKSGLDRAIDIAASVALIAATVGVIVMVIYVMTLPVVM